MASVFAWLDTDDEQQQRMRTLIDLFKDEGSVDELGIGVIRDAFSNALFPGTSILHTRCKYLLFNAWLLGDVTRRRLPADRAAAQLRGAEIRLISALLDGGESVGVIGSQAKSKLKQLPSSMYWAALGRYGIRLWDLGIAAHLRTAGQRSRPIVVSEDEGMRHVGGESGLDGGLPAMPTDLLESATFALSSEEAGYLRDRITSSCQNSLLAWLTLHGKPVDVDYAWNHPQLADFPSAHREQLDHGRRFHTAIRGAALLYNLLLAERRDESHALASHYREELVKWHEALGSERVFEGWDLTGFWGLVRSLNPTMRLATQTFVTEWLRYTSSLSSVADAPGARELVTQRELRLKGSRSRLVNQAALDAWTGGSGLVPLDYRWGVARHYLTDIHAGLKAA